MGAKDGDWRGRAGFFEGASAIVEHGAYFAEGVADDVAVVEVQRAVLYQNGGHGTAAAIELRFEDGADGFAGWRSLGRLDVGDQADHFEKQIEVEALLRGDFHENRAFAAGCPFFRS